jgi:succinate dehydrogenase/fumarate reductase flavoprotein subunit
MAGLVAAVRARELGLEPVVFEKGWRAGGSMLLSSCVIWRYRTFELFRQECPDGVEALQRLVWERFDAALAWLERLGAPIVWEEAGNPRTVGKRFDARGLTDVLGERAGEVRLAQPLPLDTGAPLVLATGGFPVRLARERGLLVRSNPWSEGDGLELARSRGAAVVGDLDEFYGRNMPAPPARLGEDDFVALAQLYARFARVENETGNEFLDRPPSWAETDVVLATARQPRAVAWYVVERAALGERIRGRPVGEMIEAARAAGGDVVDRGDGTVAVKVMPGVTHTVGGIRIDTATRVLGADERPVCGLYAAGADVGGIAAGGYASGLATALVLGLTAAETAAESA